MELEKASEVGLGETRRCRVWSQTHPGTTRSARARSRRAPVVSPSTGPGNQGSAVGLCAFCCVIVNSTPPRQHALCLVSSLRASRRPLVCCFPFALALARCLWLSDSIAEASGHPTARLTRTICFLFVV